MPSSSRVLPPPIRCSNTDPLPPSVVPSRYGPCALRVVHGAGTIDVENLETGKWFRITGLSYVVKEKTLTA
jgi:hypothetical protein